MNKRKVEFLDRGIPRSLAIAAAIASVPFLYGCGAAPVETAKVGSSGSGIGGITQSCVPITQQIPFSSQGIQVQRYSSGSPAKVVAGTIPAQAAGLSVLTPPGNYGTVLVGNGAVTGGSLLLSAPELTMQLALNSGVAPTNTGYIYDSGFGSPVTTANSGTASGFFQISAIGVQNILAAAQMGQLQLPGISAGVAPGYGYNQPYPSYGTSNINPAQICVSGASFSLNVISGQLRQGNVWLYLNNTTHGYVFDAL